MPTVSFSPIGNGYQLTGLLGQSLPGGFINTYIAGGSTPAATYTTSAGTIANTNPIQLDASGHAPFEIWLVSGTAYKFVVTDSLGVVQQTYDNIVGINDPTFAGSATYIVSNVVGTNTITGTTPLLQANCRYQFISAGPNTGAVTLNLNGTGALAVLGINDVVLTGGEIKDVVDLFYDGVKFYLMSYSALSASGGSALVGFLLPGSGAATTTVANAIASLVGAVRMVPTFGTVSTWNVYAPDGSTISTVGTTTSGLQEAINYASAHGFNLTVVGGQTSKNPGGVDYGIINCTTGITWPPLRACKISFEGVHIAFSAAVTGNGMQFDSMQECDFSIAGEITYQGTAAAVAFHPTTALPVDTTIGLGAGRVYIQSIACVGGTPTGCVSMEPAGGSIIGAHFEFEELNGSGAVGSPALGQWGLSVNITSASFGFYYNTIRIGSAHDVTGAGIQEGLGATNQGNMIGNTYDVGMILPKGASATGINTFGQKGNYRVGSINNSRGTVQFGVVFQTGASKNFAYIADLSGAGTAVSGSTVTNRVEYNGTRYWGATNAESPNVGGTYSSVNNAAGITWTAAQMIGGILERLGPAGPVNDVTATAAQIVASFPNAVSTSFYRMKIYNNSAGAITLTAGAGVTVKGWAAIASNTSRDFIVQLNNVGAGTEAVTVYG